MIRSIGIVACFVLWHNSYYDMFRIMPDGFHILFTGFHIILSGFHIILSGFHITFGIDNPQWKYHNAIWYVAFLAPVSLHNIHTWRRIQ